MVRVVAKCMWLGPVGTKLSYQNVDSEQWIAIVYVLKGPMSLNNAKNQFSTTFENF